MRTCLLCRRLEGLAYPAPVTSELPKFRVDGGTAFQTVGVDFCGPVYLKDLHGESSTMHKAYIALTTCATSRMIHLELVTDLTTPAYIRSQIRMMGRRGYPKLIISDNGRTFKSRELKKFNTRIGIKWKFNLAKSPWWGGMFER